MSAHEEWPSSAEVHVAVAERLAGLLDEQGGLIRSVGRVPLEAGWGLLGPEPHSLTTVLTVGACLSAGAPWQRAAWPAAAMECVMASADLLDDVADGELESYPAGTTGGVVLTVAAALLALAGDALARAEADDVDASTIVALGRLLGAEFARAAAGQAESLSRTDEPRDTVAAYAVAAGKSGPLGSLIARVGARTATADRDLLDLYGRFGWCLAVRSQLVNDARDATGGATTKSDVREGARTVPLLFAGSTGAPVGLTGEALAAWERQERTRIEQAGGGAVALALAEAERLRAEQALEALAARNRPVLGLRALLG